MRFYLRVLADEKGIILRRKRNAILGKTIASQEIIFNPNISCKFSKSPLIINEKQVVNVKYLDWGYDTGG
jgi:hypothetical protein